MALVITRSSIAEDSEVNLRRTIADSFAGIAPGSVLPFIAAQIIGAALGLVLTAFINSPNKTGNEK